MEKSWSDLALDAIKIAFDENGSLKKELSKLDKEKAKSILLTSIYEKKATQYWPHIKCADLCDHPVSKLKLYIESFEIEQNEFSCLGAIESSIKINNLEQAKYWLSKLIELDPENQYICKYENIKNIFIEKNNYNSSLLPSDFNVNFYMNDLNIQSELEAVLHYLNYGNKEYRQFNYPEVIFTSNLNSKKDIIIYMQIYNSNDEEVTKNINFCLTKNIENNLIDKINVFCTSDTLLYNYNLEDPKINLIFIDKRLDFDIWLKHSSEQKDAIKVLCNSDIYFDDTLYILNFLCWEKNTMYSCSRIDLDKNNNLVPSKVFYDEKSDYINPMYSQDCWIYFEDFDKDFDKEIVLGYEHCDTMIRKNCLASGCKFYNLHKMMNCIHVDYRPFKERPKYELN